MLVLRNDSPSQRMSQITGYINRLRRRLGKTDGYYGASAWQSCSREDEMMILIEFREDCIGDQAMDRFSKDKLAVDETKLSDDPADLTVFDLDANAGVRPSNAPNGTFLSISRRVASPGFGPDLEAELESTFGYLAMFEGYLGHIYGTHSALPDQVLGLALWSSEESFRSSLPRREPFELRLFRKVL